MTYSVQKAGGLNGNFFVCEIEPAPGPGKNFPWFQRFEGCNKIRTEYEHEQYWEALENKEVVENVHFIIGYDDKNNKIAKPAMPVEYGGTTVGVPMSSVMLNIDKLMQQGEPGILPLDEKTKSDLLKNGPCISVHSPQPTDTVNNQHSEFIPVSTGSKYYFVFQLKDEPELLHIIRSRRDDRYFCFWEDAYELEPWRSGMTTKSREEIESSYGIKLPAENKS